MRLRARLRGSGNANNIAVATTQTAFEIRCVVKNAIASALKYAEKRARDSLIMSRLRDDHVVGDHLMFLIASVDNIDVMQPDVKGNSFIDRRADAHLCGVVQTLSRL
jgi:hypothetical protein